MTTFIIVSLIITHVAAFFSGVLVHRNNAAKVARLEAKAKAAAGALRE